jgi:hypothetical protein
MARGLADNYLPIRFPAAVNVTGVVQVRAETLDGDGVVGCLVEGS